MSRFSMNVSHDLSLIEVNLRSKPVDQDFQRFVTHLDNTF
jgi:hypothetical protein